MRNGPLNPDDLRYVRREYVTLAEACAGRCTIDEARALIRTRRLPEASYVEEDGTERVPADYFALVDEAGGVLRLRACFVERYARAMRAAGVEAIESAIESEWQSYLDGAYGVCLKRVTPEGIFEKEALVRTIEALLRRAEPSDPRWRDELCAKVTRLDEVEREFAPCDRARFGGSVSRDRAILAPRALYPAVFE
jgi:hypothetical protein